MLVYSPLIDHMTNSFEQPPEANQLALETDSQQPSFDAEQLRLLDAVDALQPTGDPVADGKAFDEVTNQGRLESLYDSPERSLELLRNRRDQRRAMLADNGSSEKTFKDAILAKDLEALERILSYYGAN